MKRRNLILGILIGVAALVIAYIIYTSSGKNTYQWFESYNPQSEQPYGTRFIYEMLQTYRPEGKFVLNKKKTVSELLDSAQYRTDTDYILMGFSPYFDKRDLEALTQFMQRGNNVFLATVDIPQELLYLVYTSPCEKDIILRWNNFDAAKLNFFHDTLRTESGYQYQYRFGAIDRSYNWGYLAEEVLCDTTTAIVPLGTIENNYVNFFKIPFGDGNLYLHTNPLAFTNYFMVQPDKAEYASGVFSHLSGKNIIWDEFSKLPFSMNNNSYDSPLYFIMQQPSLKYAWWMMLITVIIFVIFAARRRQKVIPVIEPKTNTSLEFVTMIAALHYRNGNHSDMAKKKMKYFLYFIRTKYGIQTHTLTPALLPVLAERSGVSPTTVKHVFDKWNIIAHFNFGSIEEHRLVDLYYALESFYKTCK